MLNTLLLPLIVIAAQQAQPTLVQKSSGWCSPNIANVRGNVTVNCIGVDPRALNRLNAELDRKNLQLADKVREANEWTAKYNQLEAQLAQAGDDVRSRQAEEYLRGGELEKAGAILDQILGSEEKQVDRTAANHYNRALVFELQFKPLEALPHLKAAYQYRPGEWKYGEGYAEVLLQQNDYKNAESVLVATLENAREGAKTNPNAYQANVAETLVSLASFYERTLRMKDAEAAYREALGIRRQLAKANPAYQVYLAATLLGLGELYYTTQRMKDAEAAYQEALETFRQLAKANPDLDFQDVVATALISLASFYETTHRVKEADAAYQEALETFRQQAKANPAAYQPLLATTLVALGLHYSNAGRVKEAEVAYQEALDVQRQLAKANPAAYQQEVATTLNNLGFLYSNAGRLKEAQTANREALVVFRELAKENPAAYQMYYAITLGNLALLEFQTNDVTRGQADMEEALNIGRQLWKVNPEVVGDRLANGLLLYVAALVKAQQPPAVMCPLVREAAAVAYDPQLREAAAHQQTELCAVQ